jgi:aminopeptidase N
MPLQRSLRSISTLRTFLFPFLLAAFAAVAPRIASAQRLPDTAQPQHYTLKLTPDLKTATFAGEETIDLVLPQPASAITLNAAEIKFEQVTAEIAGKTETATVSLDPQKEQATLQFPQALAAGGVSIKIKYSGILNDELRGFYLSRTAKRNYAVTQFEPTDARRAFPSFDEPALKATFDITLVIAQGDTAISNTNIVSDTPGPMAGEHTVQFARTPRMSTYLVAFLVGDFQCLSGESDGVPIRACATPDRVQLGAFALAGAEYFLHYYDTYFGIKYPMPKLDMIALPDFEAGAMENFGAITYRETAMLVDPGTASVAAQKLVAIDVAHEMAHQWFGDMVTMNWWDNIWLNEGFATWMEHKPVTQWKPEWKIPEEVASDLNATLNLDAQKVTRAIRAKADTPGEINEMFDGISYGKAGAVLLMVENYLGEETFRKGVHAYLAAHMYSNATAEDFWNAQSEVSHAPVDKIMESLVAQPGEPLLRFGAVQGGKVEIAQSRFFLDPKVKPDADSVWTLPVCMKNTAAKPDCQILGGAAATLPAPETPVFYGNAGGTGYFRSEYDRSDYERLAAQVETALNPVERINLVGNEWALTRAERATIADMLNLAGAVRDDNSAYLIRTVASSVATIDQQLAATPEEHRALAEWVRATFGPAFSRSSNSGGADTPEAQERRAALFAMMGSIGGDPQVIQRARQIATESLKGSTSVDPTLAAAAFLVAAQTGDRAFFDQILQASERTSDPQLHSQALYALVLFRDPALVERALDYAVSGKVRNQDSARLIARELNDHYTQDVAWLYIQKNWPKVESQITITTGATLIGATGSFCSAERRDEVKAFFQEHPVPAAARALTSAEDGINQCIEFRAAQQTSFAEWTKTASGARASMADHAALNADR